MSWRNDFDNEKRNEQSVCMSLGHDRRTTSAEVSFGSSVWNAKSQLSHCSPVNAQIRTVARPCWIGYYAIAFCGASRCWCQNVLSVFTSQKRSRNDSPIETKSRWQWSYASDARTTRKLLQQTVQTRMVKSDDHQAFEHPMARKKCTTRKQEKHQQRHDYPGV